MQREKTDTSRAKLLAKISWLIYQENPDSALKMADEAVNIFLKTTYKNKLSDLYRNKGVILKNLGRMEEAEKNITKALELAKEINYGSGIAYGYFQLGIITKKKGNYKKAMDLYLRCIALSEKNNLKTLSSDSYVALANVYLILKNYDKALEYYNASLKIEKENGSKPAGIAKVLGNIGLVYSEMRNSKKAKEYFLQANELYIKGNDLSGLAFSKTTLAIIYNEEKKPKEALKEILEAAEIYKKINNPVGLSDSYANLGSLYMQMAVDKNNDKALLSQSSYYANLALKMAYENKNADNIYVAYDGLIQAYKLAGKYKEALGYKEKYEKFGDSIVNQKVHEQAMAMEKTFQSEKKQAQIELQKVELKKVSAERGEEKTQKIAYGVGLIFAVAMLIISVFGYRKIKNASRIVSAQKAEVEKQKTIVEAKNTEILDSIYYAKRIQQTLLANTEFMKNHLPEHFVFFLPKDIVSGDFYWATEKNDKFYLAVCDSTGHGVPGAFMSLLNISFLNEAIGEKNITAPNEVFNYVRERLIASVSADGRHDGMDGVLICMDKKSEVITYSAAQNSPIIIHNGEITICPFDKMPIGNGENLKSFNLFTIPEKKNGVLYLYTDGYPDQFGGEKGKKLKNKQLQEFILSISSLPISDQKNKLDKKLKDWQGDLEQVDDILVTGIKI